MFRALFLESIKIFPNYNYYLHKYPNVAFFATKHVQRNGFTTFCALFLIFVTYSYSFRYKSIDTKKMFFAFR